MINKKIYNIEKKKIKKKRKVIILKLYNEL